PYEDGSRSRATTINSGIRSSYGVDAFIASYGDPDWAAVGGNLAVCAAVGVVMLSLATWSFRRGTRA
ncbi:hypothetical protein ACWCQO_39565, partial [Streptomyces microflavus]